MSILQIQGLYKKFGQNNIINGLDLEVKENTIFGFIGENGAGKTTTMKMILGFLKQDSGVIKVCGEEVKFGETKTNKFIGYLPDVPKYYGYMTPLEYLKLCGEITNMKKEDIKKKSEELLELVGISDYKKRKISKFSRGMKQRLGIAQALLNEPKSALDPIGRKEILDILLKVKERTTVIFSTHILSDVERICDEIAILRDGKITLNGTLSQIKAEHMVDCLEVGMKNKEDFAQFLNIVRDNQNINEMQKSENTIYLHSNDIEKVQKDVMQGLINQNLYPVYIKIQEPTLERLFMEAIK